MGNTFTIDGIEYQIIRNPHTNGPMISRVDNLPIENRKEICKRFLRLHGWTDDMFAKRITNDLERAINKIVNGGPLPKERKAKGEKTKVQRQPRKSKFSALTEYLNNQTETKIDLKYSTIEEKLGFQLPDTYNDGGMVNNSALGYAMMDAGYYMVDNSYKNKVVTIKKDFDECQRIKQATKEKVESVGKTKVFLNTIFPPSAGYVRDGSNIGHEIIDIFGADNKEFYYYLNPWGQVYENQLVDCVLSMVLVANSLYRVINKAVVVSIEDGANLDKLSGDPLEVQKKKYKYNNQFIEEYYKKNKKGDTVYATYKCSGIYEPVKPIYLSLKNSKLDDESRGIYHLKNLGLPRKERVTSFTNADNELVNRIANDKSLWSKKPIKSFQEYAKTFNNKDNLCYFKELGIASQELQYSNAIRFFLVQKNLTMAFLKAIDKSFNKKAKDNWQIKREQYNIDLLITNFDFGKQNEKSKDEIIYVIENKIKANITPSDMEKTIHEQMEKTYRNVFEMKQEEPLSEDDNKNINKIKNFIKGRDLPCQLSKYYIYALFTAIKRKWSEKQMKENIKCYFLCPEYSRNLYEVNDKGYLTNNSYIGKTGLLAAQEQYKLITYKDIAPVFKDAVNTKNKDSIDYFLMDFNKAIEMQANERDNSLELLMISKFYELSPKKGS